MQQYEKKTPIVSKNVCSEETHVTSAHILLAKANDTAKPDNGWGAVRASVILLQGLGTII